MDQAGPAGDASGLWPNATPGARRPTRPPKDPLLSVTKLIVHSVNEFETALRGYLDNPPSDPEHAQCEIEVWGGAEVLVSNAESGQPGADEKKAMTIVDALTAQEDSKDVMRRQRAVAKCFIDSIQRTDGFRYAFHNNWKSGDDYRFSYYCNDSLLNKDRVANGKTGSHGKRAYKPVYDCKGVMAVKFSSVRQCVDIVYKHVPIHDTYEARAPPPRKDAKRRREWELNHPNRVRAPQYIDQPTAVAASVLDDHSSAPIVNKPPKKKKPKRSSTTAEADLREESMRSLLELIRGDDPPIDPSTTDLDRAAATAPPPNVRPTSGGQRQSTGPTALSQQQANAGRPRVGCAICRAKRIRCDGAKPLCQPCRSRVWPCFYLEPGSADDRALSASLGSFAQANGNQTGGRPVPVDLTGDSSAGPNIQLATESLSTELFETKTELALVKDKLAEAEERVKQLEAEKTRSAPTPTQRRTPQVSGIRSQQQSHDDQRKSTQNSGYGSMAYQMAQPTNQGYGAQPAPSQSHTHQPNFAAQQQQHRQQRPQSYNTAQQQQPQQQQPQPQQPQQPPSQQAQQPTFTQSQQTNPPQQQGYAQPQQPAPAQQANYGPPQQSNTPQQQQPTVGNMYAQQVRWPTYGYNIQQPNPYQNMNTRMR